MAKYISVYRGRDTKWKKMWRAYHSLDWFTRSSLVVMLLLTLMTPIVISTRLIFINHAADKFYIAATGSGENALFTMTEVVPKTVTSNSATISWSTSSPSISEVRYWKNSFFSNILAYFSTQKIVDLLYTTRHEINLSEYLEPNTSYKYTITSQTKVGDTFSSPTYSFRTKEDL